MMLQVVYDLGMLCKLNDADVVSNIWSVFDNLTNLKVDMSCGISPIPQCVLSKLKNLKVSGVRSDNDDHVKWMEDILINATVLHELMVRLQKAYICG